MLQVTALFIDKKSPLCPSDFCKLAQARACRTDAPSTIVGGIKVFAIARGALIICIRTKSIFEKVALAPGIIPEPTTHCAPAEFTALIRISYSRGLRGRSVGAWNGSTNGHHNRARGGNSELSCCCRRRCSNSRYEVGFGVRKCVSLDVGS